MRAVSALAFVALSAGLVAARAGPDVHIARSVQSLQRRAGASSPSSSTFLSDVFQMEVSQCNSTCTVSLGDFDTCSKLTNQATIAACACSAQTLGDLRACASCISTYTKSSSNATAVVSSYNSFVDLCRQEGLASVTGTVEVGASTKSMPRSSFATSISASSAVASATSASGSVTSAPLATYNPSQAPATTATVPSLLASGSIASSARAAAASAAPTNGQRTSGAVSGRASAGQALVAVVAVAAGFALLA
ncbi:hypothetical protein JCM10908_000762 [Rhodotorula pacifica]|uniref:uncharacterized protein n=1 Tax=Rhodotorula pacifica TaxID=1495444 RepID=UPI00317DA08D